ncbi:MAG: hypothetical protein A2133_08780 [Actinobacteria bacterium RBG_16_64_13]|nr:MAG: hypothetical protein A2133_08780 [Actinobacteria bacterium RBG_16_64_13]
MSRKVRMGLMAAALVVFIALCWFFLLSPIRGKIADTDSAIEAERNSLSKAQVALAQAESTREEGKRNQARLLELGKMVPPTEELPSLLLQIQDLADQSGIDFIAVTPGDPTSEDETATYLIIPLDLDFSGTFFDVSDFIYRAEQMVAGPGRLLAMKSLELSLAGETGASASPGVSPQLEVSIRLYAFVVSGGSGGLPPSGSNGSSGSSSSSTETTEATP